MTQPRNMPVKRQLYVHEKDHTSCYEETENTLIHYFLRIYLTWDTNDIMICYCVAVLRRGGSKDEGTANKGSKRKVIGRENVKEGRQKRRNCQYLRCGLGSLLSKIGYTHD